MINKYGLLISVVPVFSVVISPVWAGEIIYVDDDAPLGGGVHF